MAMFHGLMIFSAFFLDKVHLISMVPRASGPYGLKPQSGVCRELIWFISPITVVSMGFITIVYIEKVFFNQLNQQWGAAPAAPINNIKSKRLFHRSTSHLCVAQEQRPRLYLLSPAGAEHGHVQ